MKAAIISPSSAFLNNETAKQPNIYIPKYNILFSNGETLLDEYDAHFIQTNLERIAKEKAAENPPKTSTPSPQTFYDIYDQIIADGYDTVFGIYIAPGVSGLYAQALAVSQEYQDKLTIHNINSHAIATAEDHLVLTALRLIDQDYPAETIKDTLTHLAGQGDTFYVVRDMEYLLKGGRGQTLDQIKDTQITVHPIMHFNNDKLELVNKYRTTKQAYVYLAQFAQDRILRNKDTDYQLYVSHANGENEAAKLTQALQKYLPNHPIEKRIIGLSLGSHLGPDSVVFGIYPKPKNL